MKFDTSTWIRIFFSSVLINVLVFILWIIFVGIPVWLLILISISIPALLNRTKSIQDSIIVGLIIGIFAGIIQGITASKLKISACLRRL